MTSEFYQESERWVRYFNKTLEGCINSADHKHILIWEKGLNTAKEWHRLVFSENASKDEILALTGIVHANKYRNSVWYVFALEIYNWAVSKEIVLASRHEFFESDGLDRTNTNEWVKSSPRENAQALHKVFSQYSNEDPNSEVWDEGVQVINEWLDMINGQEHTDLQVSALLDHTMQNFNKYQGTSQWLDTILAISHWCKSIGKLNLAPRLFQLFFQDEAAGSPNQ